jgi:hypothetical protein
MLHTRSASLTLGGTGALLLGLAVTLTCAAACRSAQPPPSPGRTADEDGQRYIEMKLQEARDGKPDLTFGQVLTVQTQFKMQTGDYRAAVRTAEPLAQLTEIVYGPDSLATAATLEMLAQVYCRIDRCDEGRVLLQRAAVIRQRDEPAGP